MVMISCTFTLAAGFTIALRNDINLLRKDFEDLTSTKAKLIGEYAISSLLNHDKEGCEKILRIGTNCLNYRSIEVYDENGDLFSKLGAISVKSIPSHIRLLTDSVNYEANENELKLSHVIRHNNDVFGYITLHTSTEVLEEEIKNDIKVLFWAAFFIILVGGFLVFYAQRTISEPIFRLTNYLSFVAENSNTSKTIQVKRTDEVGNMYLAVNKLLQSVQKNGRQRDEYLSTIEKNNAKLGRTLDAFSDGHWEYDLKLNSWFFSTAWLETFGYKKSSFDFSNDFVEKIIHPDDLEIYKEALNDHLTEQKEYFDCDFRLLGKKGGYRWVNFKGHWVEKENGLITDMLGITVDIQHNKEEEESVLIKNERKLNETKLKALSHMVSGISHSLKNLLSPIFGYADFGLMTVNNNEQLKKELKIIKQAAKNADQIIDDMLLFAGANNFSLCRIDLIPIITTLLENWEDNNKHINFELKTTLNHATIMGDERKILQAIDHILKNAYAASFEKDSVLIELDYIVVENENKIFFDEIPFGEYVSLKVIDFGEGIERENLQKIFEPFYTTKPIGTGVGLGLSVTKGIISSHNGYIIIKSDIFKGTITHILLPTL